MRLRDYGQDDLPLQLRLLGDPATMAHLGGIETPLQIERRHERYLGMIDEASGRMLVVETVDGVAAGTAGYWDRSWRGETVWETGWMLLPEHRGRGLAAAAVAELVDRLRRLAARRFVHAFPAVGNAASNAICAKTGFGLLEALDFEYPKGHWLRCNDWRLDLEA